MGPPRRVPIGSGWDSDAVLVDGRWVERTARRPAAEAGLRREARLLPWLAAWLPLPCRGRS
ncbi:phosphotransferase [Actinomycetospora sp. CA-053990]|uniref:phosphotransferase n=1 Tax=Actinomycetospora sp. CA-053990 TaxID=3239891 RepID=UPI003D90BAA0